MSAEKLNTALAKVYDPLDEIDRRAIDLDISIADLADRAGVHHSTIYRWFDTPPYTLVALRRLIACLDILEAEKKQQSNETTNIKRPPIIGGQPIDG
jgi:predicted transcriptional regulator